MLRLSPRFVVLGVSFVAVYSPSMLYPFLYYTISGGKNHYNFYCTISGLLLNKNLIQKEARCPKVVLVDILENVFRRTSKIGKQCKCTYTLSAWKAFACALPRCAMSGQIFGGYPQSPEALLDWGAFFFCFFKKADHHLTMFG